MENSSSGIYDFFFFDFFFINELLLWYGGFSRASGQPKKKISRCWELHSGTNPTLIDYDVIFFVCYIPQIFLFLHIHPR